MAPLDREPGAGAEPTADQRNIAMLAHVGTLAGYLVGFGHILVPLAILLVKKDESAFIRANAVESLNFQISMTIWLILSGLLMFVLIGFVLMPILAIVDLVCVVLAGIKASNGESYRYPLTIRLVK